MSDPRLVRLLGGPELAALRQRLRRRYEQGLAPGTLRLTGLNEAEYAALAALLGLPARPRASVQVDLRAVDAALCGAGIAASLRAALEVLDGPLVDRAAQRERAQSMWRRIALSAAPRLQLLLGHAHGLGLLKRLSRHDESVAASLCRDASAVLARLPAAGVPRAQLAAECVGDAHALDDGQPVAALVIATLRRDTDAAAGEETAAERRRELWAGAGVLVNELARPALCLNLPGAGEAGEPGYLSLRRLLRHPPRWAVQGRDVHVCENPNIVAIAADRLGARCKPLICTDGMPAAAQRTLLAQVAQAGARLHYHGDFDWPGIVIGNHLVRRLGARAWRFGANDYLAALAGAAGARLEGGSVDACWDARLAAVMLDRGIAVAEEAVAGLLLLDLAG